MTFNPTISHKMARVSALAYDSKMEGRYRLDDWGYKAADFYSKDGTQAFIAQSDKEVIVAFRGTEPNKFKDWRTDWRVKKVSVRGQKVHRGFREALLKVSGEMEAKVRSICVDNDVDVYVTGHSAGGALALLFARFHLERLNPKVYVFGCPRVFGRKPAREYDYVLGGDTWRFVNNLDIVPRIPAWHWGYRHVGRLVYFDNRGKIIHEPSLFRRATDWVINGTPFTSVVECLKDHSVHEYVRLTAELGGERRAAA